MKELVICSGKGGTGKTSVTAALAALSKNRILVDGDVDAADLYLVVGPRPYQEGDFAGGHEAVIRQVDCDACGLCYELCRFDSITETPDGSGGNVYEVDPVMCEGCGVCVHFCPTEAIDFPVSVSGKWFISDTRHGPMVHARLKPGAENSGKLVTLVREKARELATEGKFDLILVDGPPGIGCPVTAAITNSDLILAVTEPGVSGHHDLMRLLDLAKTFSVPVAVCINKADLNPELTRKITEDSVARGATMVGEIPFDPAITQAQIHGCSVVEDGESAAADAMRLVWEKTQALLNGA